MANVPHNQFLEDKKMVQCPKCQTGYKDDVFWCPKCDIALFPDSKTVTTSFHGHSNWRVATAIIALAVIVVLGIAVTGRSRDAGRYVTHFAFGDSQMYLYWNGTGSASGFIFSPPSTFNWRKEGDRIVFSNWQGSSDPVEYAETLPDASAIKIHMVGSYASLFREK